MSATKVGIDRALAGTDALTTRCYRTAVQQPLRVTALSFDPRSRNVAQVQVRNLNGFSDTSQLTAEALFLICRPSPLCSPLS